MFDYLRHMFDLARNGELQGIHFWASAYLLIVISGSILHILRVRRWPVTQGRLLHIGVRPLGGSDVNRADQDYVPDALYRYSVAGREYQGHEISVWKMSASGILKNAAAVLPGKIHADANSTVRVYYHPKRPHKAVLLRPGMGGVLFLAGLWLAVAGFNWWQW